MEDKAFSPEISEDVIDLLDIVDNDAPRVQEGAGSDEEALELTEVVTENSEADIVDLMDIAEMPQEGAEAGPAAEGTPVEDSAESLPSMDPGFGPAAQEISEASAPAVEDAPAPTPSPAPAVSPAEMEACFGLVAEVESRVRQLEEKYEASLSALEARLASSEQKCEHLQAELDVRTHMLEEKVASSGIVFEERFAASEMKREEFAAELASFQQQIADCPSSMLNDATMLIALEEMIGRMLDARLPVEAEREEQEVAGEPVDAEVDGPVEQEAAADIEAPVQGEGVSADAEDDAACAFESGECASLAVEMEEQGISDDEGDGTAVEDILSEEATEEDALSQEAVSSEQAVEEELNPASAHNAEDVAARQAIIETIDELARHVAELEERVADWEIRCEQEAALAAARVIREEIAALKAGAARMGR